MQKKILVVDDSATIRAKLKALLEEEGYDVHQAESGAVALRELVRHKDFDLVTLDVEMPGMDGFRVCEEIKKDKYKAIFQREKSDSLPVLFITGSDTINGRRRGMEVGGADFICKNRVEMDLVKVVHSVLNPHLKYRGLKVLVVDDSATCRVILRDCLVNFGAQVVSASDGIEALEVLQRDNFEYDMIITDLNMPVMGGEQLCLEIRSSINIDEITIIVLSVADESDTKLKLFAIGADDYLTKPFIKEEMQSRLDAHLGEILNRKQLNSYLKREVELNEQLRSSREVFSKTALEMSELVKILCHDLANPIGAIKSFMELIGGDANKYTDYKDEIKKCTIKAMEVIDLVRKMRAIDEGKIKWQLMSLPLFELVKESCGLFREKISSKDITFEVDVPESIDVLVEPVSFVNSVLGNIFSNAIKFSTRGDTITISTVARDDESVELHIADQGVGMNERLLSIIFDPTKKTSRVGTEGEEGTGFGMPLVKKFVLAYGGSVDVLSRDINDYPDSHGTEFNITLSTKDEE